jgi:2-phosphosulfolactate phosphatase
MAVDPAHTQDCYDLRFEWGADGVSALAPDSGVVVVVDVLRFSTAVDAAVSRGIAVYPSGQAVGAAKALAASVGALLAGHGGSGPSLSPLSFAELPAGTAVVLPFPNGSTCAAMAAEAGTTVLAGCLRNAEAIGGWLARQEGPVTVIACGERWPGGSLRPCLEDLLGAGAVLATLEGSRSPEAEAAVAAWTHALGRGVEFLVADSASGRELREKGRGADVAYATAIGASRAVPTLRAGRFVDAAGAS